MCGKWRKMERWRDGEIERREDTTNRTEQNTNARHLCKKKTRAKQ